MRSLLPPLLLALALAGPAAAETRQVSGFTGINVSDRVRVEITTGQAHAVEVTGAHAHRIRTQVRGRTLYISDANRPWFGETPALDAEVRITAPLVRTVSAARGADVQGRLSGPCAELDLAVAMGALAQLSAAECETIEAEASMGATLRLSGSCRALAASATMGGIIRGEAMQCESVDASASMGGEVRAQADRFYDASATLGGAIIVGGGSSGRDVSTALGGSVSGN